MGRLAAAIAVALVCGVGALGSSTGAKADTTAAALAFIRNGEIRVAGLGGSASRRLTYADGEVTDLAWSPGGRTIAFVRTYEGPSYSGPQPSEIHMIRADGTRLRRLTSRLLDIYGLTWSPDGKTLVFLQRSKGVFVITAHRDGLRRLGVGLLPSSPPSWSPDGRVLAVSAFAGRSPTPSSSIFLIAADGRMVRRLTKGADDTLPLWSPDGRKVLFQRNRCDASFCGSVISVLNLEARTIRGLVRIAGGTSPSWSPDGKTIAFTRRGKRDLDIWAISADGTSMRRLTTNTYGPAPVWSPDGRRIAFVRNTSIFVMNADGSEQRKVVGDATLPAWRPVP